MYDFMKKYYIFLVDIRENKYFCAMKVGITICITKKIIIISKILGVRFIALQVFFI